MTAPLPTAWTSPMAGLFNAVVQYLNTRLAGRVAELELLLDAETDLTQQESQ